MKRIILMGEPHHDNLGDNCIALAERMMIGENFGEYEFYAMAEEKLYKCIEKAQKYISSEDVILFHGGGNIGDTYLYIEERRRKVIEMFQENKIIIFPQTVYFSDTPKGREELEITKKIYNNHNNLVMMAREEKSYELMKNNFTNAKIYLTPDIVMTMNMQTNKNRKDALLVFRGDREKTIEDSTVRTVEKILEKSYGNIHYTDMSAGSDVQNVSEEYRMKLLTEKFEQFQSAEIVITDRLHGMIFAAITGTPCIAFGNFNHKIKESFKWLKNLDYIKFCDNVVDFEKLFGEVRNVSNPKYDNEFARNIILDILNKEI